MKADSVCQSVIQGLRETRGTDCTTIALGNQPTEQALWQQARASPSRARTQEPER
jgi:hypothetical protein